MKKITKQTQSNSISFLGLLFILFLGLKLAGIGQVAKWSWWWVTAPLWGGPVLVIGIVITALVLGFFGGLIFRLIKFTLSKFQKEPTGYLNINSIPATKIVLDGKVLGNTPKVKVKVTPGAHQIKFVNDDGVKGELSVLVVANETIPIVFKFL